MTEKHQIAARIKDLVEQLRQEIAQAEALELVVTFDRSSPGWLPKRELSVNVTESVSY